MPRRSPTSLHVDRREVRAFLKAVARAGAGAILFALPLLMTMEMWWLGFYMDRLRLALFMLVMLPLLVGVSRYSGFEPTAHWSDDVVDALVAYGIAFVASAAVLALFNELHAGMPAREVLGKIALQSVPASFGAVLANSQLKGSDRPDQDEAAPDGQPFGAELLLMTAGAVFLAFNVAPTEEMILIAFRMTPWHAVALAAASLLLMHAFVYSVDFRGQHARPEHRPWWDPFLRFTVVGYALSLLVSAYVLWTFGRFEDQALAVSVMMSVVLGFPASIGAAAARLIL
jgi:putative integral membrane protein (TIGR02587 family)